MAGVAGVVEVGPDHALCPEENDELAEPDAGVWFHASLEGAGLSIAAAINMAGLEHAVITGFAAVLPPRWFEVLRRSIAASAIASRFGIIRVDAAPRHRLAGLASVGLDRFIAPA